MQSGRGKQKNWVLEFETKDPHTNSLMGWESSDDTLKEVKLKFTSKDKAIDYATSNDIDFSVIEPKKKLLLLNHMKKILQKTNHVA